MPLSKMIRKGIRNEQDNSSQPSSAANVSFTSAQPKRISSGNFVKDSLRKLHTSEPANWRRREWELETELHQAKHRNTINEEQIRVLTIERDAAEAELHTNKQLSTYLEQDFSNSTEMLAATRTTASALFDQTDALKAESREKDQLIDRLQSELSKRNAMAAVLAEVANEKEILERENEDLQVQIRDLDLWMKEIRTCAFEATAYHTNLESKLQVCDEIIHELQSTIRHDRADFEMNKKASQRTNQLLRQEVETLKAELKAEQEKRSKAEANPIDWRKECLRVHRRHSLEVEQLKADLHQKTAENERLRIQSLAHWRALVALEAEHATSAASSPIRRSTFDDSHGCLAVENSISSTATLVDMGPSSDVPVEPAAPSAESPVSSTRTRAEVIPVDREIHGETSKRGYQRPGQVTGSFVEVPIVLLCLSAALISRFL